MPPQILNDSENEDDDIVYDDSNGNSASRSSGEPTPGIPPIDVTRDAHQSTGSTERLQKQINDAQRSLCGDSSEHQRLNEKNTGQRASPNSRGDKRRHSLINSVDTTVMPKQNVARSKTMTTYSTKKPSSSNQERDQFLVRFGQDAVVPNTSTPVQFSDHSGLGSSGVLPAGSMQDEFINHEPAMFKESGSTVPDNESSHERMVEQALRSKPKDTSSPGRIKLVESTEITKSSPFPWSSEATESAKSNRVQTMQAPAAMGHPFTTRSSQPAPDQGDNAHELNASTVADSNEVSDSGATSAHVGLSNEQPVPPQSSPIVEIKTTKSKTPMIADSAPDPAASAQKPGRGRKRKVQEEESSEPLNSDDIAIGLPKERYKPRPSRRRATDVTEEPIDFSVVPEKAARSKRAKTTGSSVVSTHDQPLMSTEQPLKSTDRALDTAEQTRIEEVTVSAAPPKQSPVVEVPAIISSQSQQATFATPAAPASPRSNQSTNDDNKFAKATGKLKPISKSKRSSTTIFEDHVDFRGKQQSPSLSQQQAIRKSAIPLEDIKNGSTPAKPQHGRKVVVSDDDDDEDELSHDPAPQEEPVKKRGRGRPPKSASKANTNQSQKLVDELAGGDDNQNVAEEPPKKRRGRPPKSAAAPTPTIDDNTATDAKVDSETHKPTEEQEEEAKAKVKETHEPTTTPPKPPSEQETKATPPTPQASTTTNIPTPTLPKETPAPANLNTTPITGPNKTRPPTHSPIKKSSSPAPYRVGLSKKHRIPSLLRVMRPPPPKRG